MKDVLVYKDFIGSVHFSTEDELFFGKLEGIEDMVSFSGSSVSELKNAFIDAVEDYVQICKSTGKNPLKSFKGSFNVRLKPDLHRKAYWTATQEGKTLNQFINEAIEHEVSIRTHAHAKEST